MSERRPDDPTSTNRERKPYAAPAITFEHPTEALAATCTGSTCPSKATGQLCEGFEECASSPNS